VTVFARAPHRRSFLPFAGLGVMLALLLAAPRAQADVLDGVTGADCYQDVSQPFAPWGDSASYFLAPNGDFAGGAAGWQVSGADVVADSSPLSGGGALRLGSGESATSPGVCVGLNTPTMRFFARNAGDPDGTLRVDVRFESLLGLTLTLPIGEVSGGGAWAPSPTLPIVANLLGVLGGSHTPVAFRFRSSGGGTWLIDDVYVDPYGKG
jgi:hypothetical protein